jgi:Domain of unknown function (DUF4410)
MRAILCATLLAGLLLTSKWSVLFAEGHGGGGAQASTTDDKPTVYVSDFELDVAPKPAGTGNRPPRGFAFAAQQPGRQNPEEETRKRASQLVDWMSTKVMAALQKAGYPAVRMHRGDARPESGVQIRGLFAEIDSENHWRRAVIHSADDAGKMQALVAVANLSKPEQALYEVAQMPGNEPGPGAVITLSPYVPLTKFDVSKDAKEDVFQKIAPRIVDDLTALLNANPAAVSP